MGLPEETLRLIQETAVQAENPFEVHRDNRHAIFLIDKAPVAVDLPELPRHHTAGCLDEIIALANRFKDDTEAMPVVWYDLDHVVLVIDDSGHRLETATFPLVLSDLMTRVLLIKKQTFSDTEFIRLLRIDLAGALRPEVLLDHVRKLKWTSSDVTASNQARMKESYDRSVSHQVEAGDAPEEVRLQIPVWKSAGMNTLYPLLCTVDIDPSARRCALIPFPDEIERVQQLAVADIGKRLAEGLKDVPFYHGQP